MYSPQDDLEINAADLRDMIQEKGRVILIDVRQPEEHHEERIEPSILLPLAQVSWDSLPENPDNLPIVCYCRAGFRSNNAVIMLLSERRALLATPGLGLDLSSAPIHSLSGGIEAWKNMGFTVVKGGK